MNKKFFLHQTFQSSCCSLGLIYIVDDFIHLKSPVWFMSGSEGYFIYVFICLFSAYSMVTSILICNIIKVDGTVYLI